MGSAAAPLTRDCLLPPSMAKAPATYTHGALRNAHIHTIKRKSPIFFLYKAISSFLKKKFHSLLRSSRIPLFFWRYRSNDDSALFFFLPAVRHFLLSVDLLLQLSNKPTATFHLSPQRQASVHSASPTPQVSFFFFKFGDFFVTLRDISRGGKKV